MSETTKDELKLLISNAVADALKVQPADLECPDCHAKFDSVPPYLDHRVQEYIGTSLEGLKAQLEAFKVPTSEEFLTVCKDGVCKLVEETFNVTKKGEAAAPAVPEEEKTPTLFGHYDEPDVADAIKTVANAVKETEK